MNRAKILSAARKLGLGLRIHADQLSLSGGAKLAGELRAATADHLEHTNSEGIAALESSGVQPVLLPDQFMRSDSQRLPAAREMINAGLAIVLATDFNPGSSPTPSMLTVSFPRGDANEDDVPQNQFRRATINAAYSSVRGAKLGSLENNKSADFAIYDCDDYRELSYFFGVEHAWQVFIGGQRAFSRT
jgi:imidazolonepropionase